MQRTCIEREVKTSAKVYQSDVLGKVVSPFNMTLYATRLRSSSQGKNESNMAKNSRIELHFYGWLVLLHFYGWLVFQPRSESIGLPNVVRSMAMAISARHQNIESLKCAFVRAVQHFLNA